MGKTVEPQEQKSRRDVLKALGAAAAGTVAGSMLSAKEARADHGISNATSASSSPAIHGNNTANGTGVVGSSASGTGVEGNSVTAFGVDGFSFQGTGVRGSSFEGGTGVDGFSFQGTGVNGFSQAGTGVQGSSLNGTGVRGRSERGIGVFASSGQAAALHVEGSAKFATAGAGTIAAGQDSAVVSNGAVTALSHVTVTLTGDPGQAGSQLPVVVWVERQPGTGFVVHMARPVRVDTPFTYLIVEPV